MKKKDAMHLLHAAICGCFFYSVCYKHCSFEWLHSTVYNIIVYTNIQY